VETIREIQQTFGDDAMGPLKLKSGPTALKMSADGDQRSGRPSTSQNTDVIDKVRTSIMEGRRLTIQELVDEVGISKGSANMILTEDLGM
jgi:hypothetical protein